MNSIYIMRNWYDEMVCKIGIIDEWSIELHIIHYYNNAFYIYMLLLCLCLFTYIHVCMLVYCTRECFYVASMSRRIHWFPKCVVILILYNSEGFVGPQLMGESISTEPRRSYTWIEQYAHTCKQQEAYLVGLEQCSLRWHGRTNISNWLCPPHPTLPCKRFRT